MQTQSDTKVEAVDLVVNETALQNPHHNSSGEKCHFCQSTHLMKTGSCSTCMNCGTTNFLWVISKKPSLMEAFSSSIYRVIKLTAPVFLPPLGLSPRFLRSCFLLSFCLIYQMAPLSLATLFCRFFNLLIFFWVFFNFYFLGVLGELDSVLLV